MVYLITVPHNETPWVEQYDPSPCFDFFQKNIDKRRKQYKSCYVIDSPEELLLFLNACVDLDRGHDIKQAVVHFISYRLRSIAA